MTDATLRTAGILLIVLPTVAFGGASILYLWITRRSEYYLKNRLRQRLWAAGHAHAGVLLVLSLVALQYLDATNLGGVAKAFVRWAIPSAAILVPAAYFLSVVKPDVEKPNALINLAYIGFLSLTAGLLILGIGLISAI
ncbi:MAG: hypothetical protein A2Y73_03490 [Chloroflexi bacterium RBG_13_56_8]|nr:MAG: hypothetical protein A2Y73_03490 [Chloroflexi bacterium RBG_13_56_8]